MTKTAAVLLLLTFCLLTAGATLIAIPAGLITAGALTGAAGVLSLNASSRPKTRDGKAAQ